MLIVGVSSNPPPTFLKCVGIVSNFLLATHDQKTTDGNPNSNHPLSHPIGTTSDPPGTVAVAVTST